MTIATWIVSALLALAFLASGGMKAVAPVARLHAQMAYTKDIPIALTRVIGIVEVLGAVGVIVPWLTGIAPILTPLAAAGLALIQVIAIVFHLVRKEVSPALGLNVVLLAGAVFVAIARFAGF